MTSKCKYAADGTPYAEVRMLNAENYSVVKCLNIASKPEQGLKDFTFCFKDGTSATFKNAGSLQEFLDKLARFHELEKKLKIARKALEEIKKHNKAIRSVLGEQIPEKSTDIEEYCWWASCRIQDCLNNALEQIKQTE